MGIVEKVSEILPRFDLKEGVHAQHKVKVQIRLNHTVKDLQGFNGVGKAFAPRLEVQDFEKGRFRGCNPRHFKPVLKGGHSPLPFVGREGCRDEIDVFEVEALPDLLGQAQVAVVNGIKGSAQDPQSRS
jgi:hypothetical protein